MVVSVESELAISVAFDVQPLARERRRSKSAAGPGVETAQPSYRSRGIAPIVQWLTTWPALAAVLLVTFFAPPAAAQEAFAFVSMGEGHGQAFREPSGFGLAARFPATDWLSVQAELGNRRSDELSRVGEACVNPDVDFQCGVEPIRTLNSMRSAAITVLPSWRPWDPMELMAGAGVMVGQVDSDNRTRLLAIWWCSGGAKAATQRSSSSTANKTTLALQQLENASTMSVNDCRQPT